MTVSIKETVNSRKRKRNAGKEYFTKTGNCIKERNFKELQDCRKKCKDKISYVNQKHIFDAYWGLGSHNSRLQYLSGLIEVKAKKTARFPFQLLFF